VQIDHDARNSITFKFKDRFVQFLRGARENGPTIPCTLEALAEQAGIHVVVAGGPDGGLKGSVAVAYRTALYVAGDEVACKNALLLLDGFFVREARDETPVHLHAHLGVDIKDIMQDLSQYVSAAAS